IPIIAGFQGMTKSGDITTLGRGGSDITASIMGKALDAEAIEIYTDVDGVMTADPRIVPDASIIDSMPYEEIFQMAEYGAKVIHARTEEIGMRNNIHIVIKNTNRDFKGTLITRYYKLLSNRKVKKDKIITTVAQINDSV